MGGATVHSLRQIVINTKTDNNGTGKRPKFVH